MRTAFVSRVFRAYLRLFTRIDQYLSHFGAESSVRIPVADEHDQGQAVTGLVRTRRRLRSVGSGHFVQEPVARGAQALLVLDSVRIEQCQPYSFEHPLRAQFRSIGGIRSGIGQGNLRSARHLDDVLDCSLESRSVPVDRPERSSKSPKRQNSLKLTSPVGCGFQP